MNDAPTALTCPKCGAEMRRYERNGVVIDQCLGCRGVFLDRGELESLIDAESSFYAAPPAPGPGTVQPHRATATTRGTATTVVAAVALIPDTRPQARRVPRGPLRLDPDAHTGFPSPADLRSLFPRTAT